MPPRFRVLVVAPVVPAAVAAVEFVPVAAPATAAAVVPAPGAALGVFGTGFDCAAY